MDDQVIIETTFFSIENILFEIFKMFFLKYEFENWFFLDWDLIAI